LAQWHGLSLGPEDADPLQQDDHSVVLLSQEPLARVEEFYLARMAEAEWVLLEQLHAPETDFGGDVSFLFFWQSERTVCVLISSEPTSGSTVIKVSEDCGALRETAEDLRAKPWDAPAGVAWREWLGDSFTVHYPSGWKQDASLSRQPYCQPGTNIRCLAAWVVGNESADALIVLVSKPRPSGKSLEELAVEGLRQVVAVGVDLELIAAESIQLDDGAQAVQLISRLIIGNEQALFTTVSMTTEADFYSLTATITGNSQRVFELNSVVLAVARSFHFIDQ